MSDCSECQKARFLSAKEITEKNYTNDIVIDVSIKEREKMIIRREKKNKKPHNKLITFYSVRNQLFKRKQRNGKREKKYLTNKKIECKTKNSSK